MQRCLVFCLWAGLAAAQPRARDIWLALEADGVTFGYVDETVRPAGGGRFRYRLETRSRVDFLGAREEIRLEAEYLVTAAYRSVSLRVVRTSASGRTAWRVERRGERYEVLLEIRPPTGELPDLAYPITGPEFGPCLASGP